MRKIHRTGFNFLDKIIIFMNIWVSVLKSNFLKSNFKIMVIIILVIYFQYNLENYTILVNVL